MTRSRALPREDSRGQTLPDFVVAVAIFLLAVTFVVAIVPQLLLPFDGQERPVVAERAAGGVGAAVTESGTASALNESATRSFFDLNETEARDRLAVEPWYALNITLRDAPSYDPASQVLCSDGGDDWITADCSTGDPFAAGRPVPRDDGSVATVRRSLFVGDTDVVLEVRVW